MYEKKHWDGDLADLTGQCVKGGLISESFEIWLKSLKKVPNAQGRDL